MTQSDAHTVVNPAVSSASVAMEVSRLHGFLAAVFRKEISAEQLTELRSPETAAILRDAGVNLEHGFGDRSDADILQDLAVEYAALFIGPGEHISPHESVQVDAQNGVLWGDATVEVRSYIEATGMVYADDFRGIPDHVSVELEFMSELARRESIAWRAGCIADARNSLECQQEFLRDHLGRWLVGFCDKVVAAAEHPFYRDMACLAAGFIESEIGDVKLRLAVARQLAEADDEADRAVQPLLQEV